MGNGVSSSVLTASNISLGSLSASNMKSLLEGARWDLTTSRVITYSFPSGTAYYASNYSSRDEWSTWSAFNETMKSAARAALAAWSDVANVTFVEVADTQGGAGDIRFAWTTRIDASHSAWAYYPYSGASGGDVWVKSSYNTAGLSVATGSFMFYTLLHEIGHALGLKHSFEAGDTNSAVIDAQYDSTNYTVMSYDFGDDYPSTPMYYDIQAIQYLYGANSTAKSGNDTYTLANASFTIWDTGGTDTLSFANVASNASIDLRANSTSRNAAGTYVLIMPNVTVENAVGSPNSDNIWGNDSGNSLAGGSGADSIQGLGGIDSIDGDGGNDTILAGDGDDFVRALDDNDLVYGGAGADDVNGNQGQDVVYGDDGADSVRGGQGNDTVFGNEGDDPHVNGNIGADIVYGGNGNDQIFGGQNDDGLYGDAGNDTLSGDLGNDTLTGGAGADRFLFRPSTGADQIQDFNFAEGDRIALPAGTSYSFVTSGGATSISLGGTDILRLVGITSAGSASWIVFA